MFGKVKHSSRRSDLVGLDAQGRVLWLMVDTNIVQALELIRSWLRFVDDRGLGAQRLRIGPYSLPDPDVTTATTLIGKARRAWALADEGQLRLAHHRGTTYALSLTRLVTE